jgi:hypothetical protein
MNLNRFRFPDANERDEDFQERKADDRAERSREDLKEAQGACEHRKIVSGSCVFCRTWVGSKIKKLTEM